MAMGTHMNNRVRQGGPLCRQLVVAGTIDQPLPSSVHEMYGDE
jgi:hypothetical protein